MHEDSSFITLTYSDEHIKDNVLCYRDIQLFIKKLRKHIDKESHGQQKIGVFTSGEYGDKTKRAHWHLLVFGYRPPDLKDSGQSSHDGHSMYASELLDQIWGYGITRTGSVTLQSAGYCARYALKKLTHGDDSHDRYSPISRRSSKYAIGKKWLELYWRDVFTHGYVEHQGKKFPVPRYYEKWLKKHKPSDWRRYVTEVKPKLIKEAIAKEEKISLKEKLENFKRSARMGLHFVRQRTRNETRKKIIEQKTQKLKEQKC